MADGAKSRRLSSSVQGKKLPCRSPELLGWDQMLVEACELCLVHDLLPAIMRNPNDDQRAVAVCLMVVEVGLATRLTRMALTWLRHGRVVCNMRSHALTVHEPDNGCCGKMRRVGSRKSQAQAQVVPTLGCNALTPDRPLV